MNNKKIIEGISLIKSSNYRLKILKCFIDKKFLTPTDLAKMTNIRVNHISNYLFELKKMELIVCLNEKNKKGRLYQITELGKEVLINLGELKNG